MERKKAVLCAVGLLCLCVTMILTSSQQEEIDIAKTIEVPEHKDNYLNWQPERPENKNNHVNWRPDEDHNSDAKRQPVMEETHHCYWKFTKYESSPVEKKFIKDVGNDHVPCNYFKNETVKDIWVKTVQKAWAQKPCGGRRHYPIVNLDAKDVFEDVPEIHYDPDIFSVLHFEKECVPLARRLYGTPAPFAGATTRVEYIEPLAGPLRHPGVCWDDPQPGPHLVDKEYLVTSTRYRETLETFKGRLNSVHFPKSYYLDGGASTWTDGFGGVSQAWFVDHYHETECASFDEMWLWEVTPHVAEDVFKQMPADLIPHYHWFNIPLSADRGHPNNPIEVIKMHARQEDFVVLKIDIDTPSVENPLFDTLLLDKEALSLVDEVFYEHHVYLEPLASCCWWTHASSRRPKDSIEIFLKLRNAGVRGHSWV